MRVSEVSLELRKGYHFDFQGQFFICTLVNYRGRNVNGIFLTYNFGFLSQLTQTVFDHLCVLTRHLTRP